MTSTQTELEQLREQLQEVRAQQTIRNRIYSYARALDRIDPALLAEQFWPEAQIEYGEFYRGPVAGFLDVAMRFQSAMRNTQHLVGNVLIQVAGDRASAESYVHAHHVIVDSESLVQLSVGARYLDRFERRGTDWRISFRTEVLDWGRRLPISENWFETTHELPKGERGNGDLSYRFLS